MSVLSIEDEDAMPGDVDWVSAWVFGMEAVSIASSVGDIARGSSSEYQMRRAEKWLEQLDAYIADGYVAGEADMAVADFISDFLNESEVPEQ